MTTQVQASPQAKSTDSVAGAVITALVAGLMLLFVSGYAQATILHDAAHDQRHAMAFPCH